MAFLVSQEEVSRSSFVFLFFGDAFKTLSQTSSSSVAGQSDAPSFSPSVGRSPRIILSSASKKEIDTESRKEVFLLSLGFRPRRKERRLL